MTDDMKTLWECSAGLQLTGGKKNKKNPLSSAIRFGSWYLVAKFLVINLIRPSRALDQIMIGPGKIPRGGNHIFWGGFSLALKSLLNGMMELYTPQMIRLLNIPIRGNIHLQ